VVWISGNLFRGDVNSDVISVNEDSGLWGSWVLIIAETETKNKGTKEITQARRDPRAHRRHQRLLGMP